MHIACQKGAKKCVRLLSWHDAELAQLKLVPDAAGRLPFDVARDSAVRACMQTLWEAAAGGRLDAVTKMLRRMSSTTGAASTISWKPWRRPGPNDKTRVLRRTPLHACCHGVGAALWKLLGGTSARGGARGGLRNTGGGRATAGSGGGKGGETVVMVDAKGDPLPRSSKFVLQGLGYRAIHGPDAATCPFPVVPARMQPQVPRSGPLVEPAARRGRKSASSSSSFSSRPVFGMKRSGPAADGHGLAVQLDQVQKLYCQVARQLLGAGADPSEQDEDGQTPLMLAARSGCRPLVEMLVGAGALVGARDSRGNTALHWSQAFERSDVVEALEDEGADNERENHDGKKPFECAGMRFKLLGSGSAEGLLEVPAGRLASECLPVDGVGSKREPDGVAAIAPSLGDGEAKDD